MSASEIGEQKMEWDLYGEPDVAIDAPPTDRCSGCATLLASSTRERVNTSHLRRLPAMTLGEVT